MRRIIEAILCIFVGIFLFGIIAITFQVIGEDSPNKASIIGGILSMLGGAIGAFGAYFIARMQMTKQLDLQYKKEREKMIIEIKINKYQELLITYDNILQMLNLLQVVLIDNIFHMRMPNITGDKVRACENNIRVQLNEVKMNLPRINAYMSYFEEDEIKNIPDFIEVMHKLEDDIYLLIIRACDDPHPENYTEEEFQRSNNNYKDEINVIVNTTYKNVFTLANLIQQKIDKIIKS
ncbi:hypothetical protein V4V34_08045 [Lysinibacillus sphaericus]|uniref:hypothetical protein n=1 Tax=Lysinibacillus TaxID=400634 RepID=UPI002FBDD895